MQETAGNEYQDLAIDTDFSVQLLATQLTYESDSFNDQYDKDASNADGSWPSYAVNNTGKLILTDTNITSVHGGVASYGDGAVVTMNNTNLNMSGIPGFTSHGLYTYNNGQIVVNGGNIANNAAADIGRENNTITVTNCTYGEKVVAG